MATSTAGGQVSITEAIKNLLFPARCLACKRQLERGRLPQICDDCLLDHFAFDRARAMFLYQEPVKSLLLSFKFGGRLTGLATLGALTKQAGVDTLFSEPDLVLPVPLHIRRLRSRGFNQSLLLARTCFPAWRHKIYPDILLRMYATTPQTRLSGKARRTNLNGAFAVPDPQKIKGKRILLIDDIFTTGSTLHECAKILRQAGAKHIDAFTLARAI